MIEPPKFRNEKNLKHCLNTPHCFFDAGGLGEYSKKEVLDLIHDVELFYDFFTNNNKLELPAEALFSKSVALGTIKAKEDFDLLIMDVSSRVWAGIWHFHEAIVPKKYKEESL